METLSNSSVMEKEAAKEAGLEILRKLGWPLDSGFADMDPRFWDFTTGHLFGQVWARPGLSLRDRAMITLAVLLAVDADRGSLNHLRYAHNVGITEEEVRANYSGRLLRRLAQRRARDGTLQCHPGRAG